MDGDKATRFVASLVKSIQALCNGYIDFSSSIEVIGHIHLNIDRSVKLDYVLTEEVSKSINEDATVFASHSYHSQPPSSVTPSTSANDTSSHRRQKQSGVVSKNEDSDPLGFGSLPSEKHHASSRTDSQSHSHTLNRFGENSDSAHASRFDARDIESVKLENSRTSVHEPLDRRRKNALPQTQPHRTTSPPAKRSRQTDYDDDASSIEVIEIKEEPDDEPTVFFGDGSSHISAGQDLQTPDFSTVVMESLDRVGQVEGTNLVAGNEGMQVQQSPFPVVMHSKPGMSSSSASLQSPGPSASSSGVGGHSRPGHLSSSWSPLHSSSPYSHPGSRLMAAQQNPSTAMDSPDLRFREELQRAAFPFHLPRFLQSKMKKQYSPQQMLAAMADVDAGKPVSRAARAHGIPLRSLYRKLKNRSSHPADREQQMSGSVSIEEDWAGPGSSQNTAAPTSSQTTDADTEL